MHEKKLLRIALVCSLAGLVLLFMVGNKMEFKKPDMPELEVGKDVELDGTVKRVQDFDDVISFKLGEANHTIDIVVFKPRGSNLTKGDRVKVLGEVGEYQGGLQVIAHKIYN